MPARHTALTKAAVFTACLLPLAYLAWRGLSGGGADPSVSPDRMGVDAAFLALRLGHADAQLRWKRAREYVACRVFTYRMLGALAVGGAIGSSTSVRCGGDRQAGKSRRDGDGSL